MHKNSTKGSWCTKHGHCFYTEEGLIRVSSTKNSTIYLFLGYFIPLNTEQSYIFWTNRWVHLYLGCSFFSKMSHFYVHIVKYLTYSDVIAAFLAKKLIGSSIGMSCNGSLWYRYKNKVEPIYLQRNCLEWHSLNSIIPKTRPTFFN